VITVDIDFKRKTIQTRIVTQHKHLVLTSLSFKVEKSACKKHFIKTLNNDMVTQ